MYANALLILQLWATVGSIFSNNFNHFEKSLLEDKIFYSYKYELKFKTINFLGFFKSCLKRMKIAYDDLPQSNNLKLANCNVYSIVHRYER